MTISVGESGSVSTVYNVGKIDKDTLPNGKIKTIYSGSKANSISSNNSISQNSEKSTPSVQEISGKVSRSRNVTGETVTISKGELAKLHANYAGDKVFARKSVTEAVALHSFH